METSPIWNRTIEALKEAGLPTKQVDIAKLCNVKPPSVHEWKSRGPGDKHILVIAMATNVTVDWIKTGRPPKHPDPKFGSNLDAIVNLIIDIDDAELGPFVAYARHFRDLLDSQE